MARQRCKESNIKSNLKKTLAGALSVTAAVAQPATALAAEAPVAVAALASSVVFTVE